MTEHSGVTKVQRMKALVGGGKTVRQAARKIFGRVADYYDQTTEAERETVYCKPVPAGPIRCIRFNTSTERASDIERIAKAEGLNVTAFLNKLVAERITLSKSTK